MTADFPETRAALEKIPAWVNELAATVPKPLLVPFRSSFRWEHGNKTPQVAQVAKAARLATALRASLVLADAGLTTETPSLLRIVGDLNGEIQMLAEVLTAGRATKDQQDFLDQFFEDLPLTPEDLAAKERTHFVGRGTVAKAIARLFHKAPKASSDEHAKNLAYLHAGYDRYVHAKYTTAMELFNGRYFMLTGSEFPEQIREAMTAVAGKTVESLLSLRLMAKIRGIKSLEEEIKTTIAAVTEEHEQSA